MFACDDFGYVPDIITCAKGLTSGYSPIGAMIASDRLFEPFNDGKTMFGHGYTFGGHPVSSAVALANLDIFEREGINDHVKQNAPAFRATLEKLLRPADRRRRPRRGLLLRHRTGQGQGHQGDVQRRRVRAAAARLPDPGAVRGRPVLPRRRPRRPSRAAGAAADQRAEGVRRDLRDPARRARRSAAGSSMPSPPKLRSRGKFAYPRRPVSANGGENRRSIRSGGRAARRPAARLSAGRADASSRSRATHPRTSSSTPTGLWTGVDDGRSCGSTDGGHARSSPTPAAGRWAAVGRDGRLLVCDSPRGLLAMDSDTGAFETLVRLGREPASAVLLERHRNADGTIYFTESTSAFTLRPLYGGDPGGPRPRQPVPARSRRHRADALVPGLYFANGVTPTATGRPWCSPRRRPAGCRSTG